MTSPGDQLGRQELPKAVDVVVVGGGVIGAACAHALAESQVSVALLERGDLAGGASGACEGNVLVSDKLAGPELDLARRSVELYRGLEDRLDAELEFEAKGGLLVALTDADRTELEAVAESMTEAGIGCELLEAPDVSAAEPCLRPDLAGGLLVPDDAQVWPMKVVFAFARAAARLGARIVRQCRVSAVKLSSGRVSAVLTDRGSVACSSVVLAAGLQTRDLLADLGLTLPLVGCRGNVLVTAPLPGLVNHKVYDVSYRRVIRQPDEQVQIATVLETTRRGNVLIGASRVSAESAGTPDVDIDSRLAAGALELAPQLASTRLIRSYAGVRPALPDSLPAIGPAGIAGVWIAAGHDGAGIGLAPGTAELLRDLMTGSAPQVGGEAFAPARWLGGEREARTSGARA